MVALNLMVVFGPTDDSYFVTYGRRMHYKNMPDSLVKTFKEQADMNPMNVAWLRMHPNGKTWVAMNMYNLTLWYDLSIQADLLPYIKGDQYGAKKAASLSWTDDGRGYFVKLRGGDGWTMDVPDEYPLQIAQLRRQLSDFDQGIKTILFGQGGTHVYIFERGFVAHFEGTAEDSEHPLNKIFQEFGKPGWDLHETSCLSPYNNRHFLLKFQQQGTTTLQMRWSLPDAASKGLKELMEIAEQPEEKAFLARFEQNTQNAEMVKATGNFALSMHARYLFGPW
ncbi:hypothetical protein PsYK624_062750 [Phanerochaete sordida]|uniref:Uncharacterized protein n=1 Tax=Phanerochaete sordida TaxID=48140 RepID=A0A9P3GA11_9APHY|nr:hypothetical protein PsYK624_062750 [Phanerochaete sordida]